MGTLEEWISALFLGVFWGGVMFWVTQPIEPDERKKLRPYSILAWALGGVLFGFTDVFGLRVFRRPLVIVLMAVLIAFLIAVTNHRKQMRLIRARESSRSS
jgi:hypothetical protein